MGPGYSSKATEKLSIGCSQLPASLKSVSAQFFEYVRSCSGTVAYLSVDAIIRVLAPIPSSLSEAAV